MSRQDDIKKLIFNYERRLQKLKERQAITGMSTAPEILIEIEDIEVNIEKLQAELSELQSLSHITTSKSEQSISLQDEQIVSSKAKLEEKPLTTFDFESRGDYLAGKNDSLSTVKEIPQSTFSSNYFSETKAQVQTQINAKATVINLRNVRAIAEAANLVGHVGSIYSVKFSPNNILLASASKDHTVRLWFVAKRIQVARLIGARGAVRSIDFSPDSELLVAGADDKFVHVWGMPYEDVIKIFLKKDNISEEELTDKIEKLKFSPQKPHSNIINSVAFSPKERDFRGKFLAVGSKDQTVRVYKV